MRLIEEILPRFCILCESKIDSAIPFPLCRTCAETLPRTKKPACARCGKSLVSEKDLCMRCRSAEYHFNGVSAIFPYADQVKTLLSAYKTHGRTSLALFFAEEIFAVLRGNFQGCAVVPVPPRPGKIRKKGWDQVDAIMRILSARRSMSVHRILRRVRGDVQQKTLNRDQRASNIQGKFYFHSVHPAPRRIVLVDDVFTTGATLSECAFVLREAGAASVHAVCIAID